MGARHVVWSGCHLHDTLSLGSLYSQDQGAAAGCNRTLSWKAIAFRQTADEICEDVAVVVVTTFRRWTVRNDVCVITFGIFFMIDKDEEVGLGENEMGAIGSFGSD